MIEREVTDILIGTVSTLLLFILVQSPSESFLVTILLICHSIVLFLNFGHIILRQLNRLSDDQSLYFVVGNFVLLLVAFTVFLFVQPVAASGFWDILGETELSYDIICYLNYAVLGVLVYLSKDAKLLVPNFAS